MSLLVLRQIAGTKPNSDVHRFRLGRTGCLSLLPDTALVFSSHSKAMSYCGDKGIHGVQVADVGIPDGHLLECLGSIDRCGRAMLDGTTPIRFMSCESGGFVLPSHFIRYRENRFEALQNDDEWHESRCTPENPNCQCGGMLFPFNPCGVASKKLERAYGIFQVIAGSRTLHDGTGCLSLAVLDMKPPPTKHRVEIQMEADDCVELVACTITPDGFCSGDMEGSDVERWEVCPLSGLCRVQLPTLTSRDGLEAVTLTVTAVSDLRNVKGQRATSTFRGFPIIPWEIVSEAAFEALQQLRQEVT